MNFTIDNLLEVEEEYIEKELEKYDEDFIGKNYSGEIKLACHIDDKLAGGIIGYITTFNILYISTLFVKEKYRRMGIGKLLIENIEVKAKEQKVNTIRLDTFNWQGKEFYLSLGYEIVGEYYNGEDNYGEYFFIKRI